MKIINVYRIPFLIIFIFLSCDNTQNIQNTTVTMNDSLEINQDNKKVFQSIKFIDSFLNKYDNEINKNSALKEHYEGVCTKIMLPLIDKKGLYNDLPFELVMTTLHNGTAYGNFIYNDEKHFVKVTCIIKKNLLEKLEEKNKYYIKFKTNQFEEGVTFKNSFDRIELPTVNGYLTSFVESEQ